MDYKVSTESAGLEKSWHKVRLGFVYIFDYIYVIKHNKWNRKSTTATSKQTADFEVWMLLLQIANRHANSRLWTFEI